MAEGNYSNPTRLKVGASGFLEGQQATVQGHAILKSADGYRWDEYHVVLADRTALILVYEAGGWKRYALFTPKIPVTAAEADRAAVGRMASVGDGLAKVTYVSASRVIGREGQLPRDYESGNESDYFNADDGHEQFVVSWIDNDVECYRGRMLPPGDVERAFNLPLPFFLVTALQKMRAHLGPWAPATVTLVLSVGLVLLAAFGASGAFHHGSPTTEPPPPLAAPHGELRQHQQGTLAGHQYTLSGHRRVRVDDPAGRFERHEYELVDDQGGRAVLVQSINRDPHQWVLLLPATDPIDSYTAATYVAGSRHLLAGTDCIVRQLFRSEEMGWDGVFSPKALSHDPVFGFVAQTGAGYALVRWNSSQIEVLLGQNEPEAEVVRSFGPLQPP